MTITVEKIVGDKFYIKGYCTHDETKPTDDVALGSSMLEVDTGDKYYFVDDTSGWEKH